MLLAWDTRGPALDALVVAGGTYAPLARLAAPNPSRGLGAYNAFTSREVHAAVGDFDGDGTPDVVLTQENDGNAAPEASRVYRYALSGFGTASEAAPSSAVSVEVGPNPARSRFTVRADVPAASRLEVEVYDAVGRRVAQASAEAGAGEQTVPFDTSGLAPGLYLVRVRTGDHVSTRTVTVVR